LVPLADNRLIP